MGMHFRFCGLMTTFLWANLLLTGWNLAFHGHGHPLLSRGITWERQKTDLGKCSERAPCPPWFPILITRPCWCFLVHHPHLHTHCHVSGKSVCQKTLIALCVRTLNYDKFMYAAAPLLQNKFYLLINWCFFLVSTKTKIYTRGSEP